MDEKQKLAQLDDLVIEEILSMSEVELRSAEASDAVDAVRSDLEKAIGLLGKADLAQAKAELAAYRAESRVIPFAAKVAGELNALRASDRSLDSKLTMAARNAQGDDQEDIEGIEQDLAELDAWKDKDREQP
jgi:hypothetical protein